MNYKKFGVGIIGCGKSGYYHSYWYSKNPYCNLIGFYNRSIVTAKNLAKKYGAKTFRNWEDLVKDPDINVISICTPVFQHCDQACLALNLKKNVLCEKPMAVSTAECRKMIKTSQKNNAILGLFFNMRFNPVVEAVDKNINKIGEILSIDMNFQFNRKDLGWRGEFNSKTGVLLELGTHAIDLAIHWLGDIKIVKAEVANFKHESFFGDHAFILCKFKNGTMGKLYLTYNDPSFYDEQIEGLVVQILGREGKICFLLNSYDPDKNRVFIIKDNIKSEIFIKKPEEYDEIYPGHMDSFSKLINKFINAVMDKEEFIPSGTDGMKSIKFIEDAFKSSDWRR